MASPMQLFEALEKAEPAPALNWGLSFARGYLELGMIKEAERELDKLSIRYRCYADVLEMRVRVFMAAGKMAKAARLAKSAAKVYPGVAEFYLLAARAYEAMRRPDRAKEVWVSAPSLFHVSGVFHYNLARFEAQLGNPRSAREHIALAIELDPKIRNRVAGDPGLRALMDPEAESDAEAEAQA